MATDTSPIEEVLDGNNNADTVFDGDSEPTTQRRGIDASEVDA